MKMRTVRFLFTIFAGVVAPLAPSFAWDYEGHRVVNHAALASLPTNFPAFVLAPEARERIAFLSGEPDRWRNTTDLPLRHCNGPDHYFDVDELAHYQLEASALSHFRYEFVGQLAVARATKPEKFPAIDPTQDRDKTRAQIGFLPWAITEYYAKLKSGFSYLKAFEEAGTPEEIANARQNILYVMGTMGHFVGDLSQPLHTTKNFNGWVGENTNAYTTSKGFHAWIDGGFLQKVGMVTLDELRPKLRPARSLWNDPTPTRHADVFPEVMAEIVKQFQLVEPLYQMDKAGKLSATSDTAREGRAFLAGQLLLAAQLLGDLWFSAWQQAGPDTFLMGQLAKRKAAAESAPPKKP
jgi:hypothetical protein